MGRFTYISSSFDDDDDITGDVGLVIEGNTGTIHLGQGDIVSHDQPADSDSGDGAVHIAGDGAVYIAGDNYGGIRRTFK